MAKKKHTAKRSTKAGKRRPTMQRKPRSKILSKGEAGGVGTASGVGASTAAGKGNKGDATGVSGFQRGVFQPGVFQTGENVAVQSTQGVSEPPPAAVAAPQGGEAQFGGVGDMGIDTIQFAAPISPTFYTEGPQGTVIVQNHVTINIQGKGVEFREFDKDMKALIGELRRSNEISGEVRDQLLSELRAGSEIITGPKPQRGLIDLLLVRPLKWLVDKSGSAIIAKLAGDALEWLLKML